MIVLKILDCLVSLVFGFGREVLEDT
jgi:hypothetical protein